MGIAPGKSIRLAQYHESGRHGHDVECARGVGMIVELVTFTRPDGWERTRVVDDAKHTIPKWVANRDPLRKHFALGIGQDAGTIAGIYVWPSIEAAKRAHDEEWRESVKRRTGGYPTIRYFDLFMLIDNEKGRVIEWAEDGKAREVEVV